MPIGVRQLTASDLAAFDALLRTFGEAFDDLGRYTSRRPSDAYLRRLLVSPSFIALAAVERGDVIGGLAAYELQKFEQECSEIYIYDLAVAAPHRRRGVATALIQSLKRVAVERGATVIFVQANTDEDDQPAIALYSKLGTREDVLHFDIAIEEAS
jgi:aminoglycoside 3-N-acetyltransferase I